MSVKANRKKRLILALRYVNKFLHMMHVKYEDWKTAISYFARGAYMFSFDLKSGYHHVEICKGHQTYLGFSWKHAISNPSEVLCVHSFAFRIIVRPPRVHKNP